MNLRRLRAGDRWPWSASGWLRVMNTRSTPDAQSIATAQRVTTLIASGFGVPALLCLWLYVLFYQRDNLLLLYLPLAMGLLLLSLLVHTWRFPGGTLGARLLPFSTLLFTLACLIYRAAAPTLFSGDLNLLLTLLVVLAGVAACLRFPPMRAGLALALLLLLHSLPLLGGLAHRTLVGPGLLSSIVTELVLTSVLALMYSSVWTQLALGHSEATSLQMEYLSQTDHLTGLPNRRSLYSSIEALMAEVRQEVIQAPQPTQAAEAGETTSPAAGAAEADAHAPAPPTTFALALLDIDHFKSVNDTFGHASGDTVLCGVAEVLSAFVRQRDLAGRWGGEEFLMVLPGVPLERAQVIAERLRNQIEAARILPGCTVTASFGVTVWQPGDTLEALIARADTAMYRAKHGGRNRVEVSAPELASTPGPSGKAWHTQPT